MHFPVLLREVIDYLDPTPGDIILDATMGGGGHSSEIIKRISPGGRLIALDRDPEAIERVKKSLSGHKEYITYVNDNFRNIKNILDGSGSQMLDGAIFDLGMSSFQVDDAERGFSFLNEGPLDMRFDPHQEFSARDAVNTLGREALAGILKEYGEERHAKLVARAILDARKKKTIETTGELVQIIEKSVGGKYRSQRIHSACRTFQALRIYVNDELDSLKEGINGALSHMRSGSRICVISFHSLEDRIVKNLFRDKKRSGELKVLTKKPVVPTSEEMRTNSRSRSAKLRVAEKAI